MHTHQLWQRLSPELNHQILETAYLHDKKLYRMLVEEGARLLRQRTQRLLDSPRKERHQLFQPMLGMPELGLVAQNLITRWLFSAQVPMMTGLLDALNIVHDGEGRVDDLPEDVDAERLKQAVEQLYQKFDAEAVSVYLTALGTFGGCSWKTLNENIRPLVEPVTVV